MSGSSPTPAEQHLGDRLAALVDGELGHDARERVLAHLATCAKCKAEADAQRRLKSVFAEAAPPSPSEGFLARLQGLPGGGPPRDDDDEGRGPDQRGLFEAAGFGSGAGGFGGGLRTGGFSYAPAGAHGGVLPGGPGSGSGFRIHEVGRQEAERSPWRGRRFAFAAASAVSFAAMALGGAMPLGSAADAPLPRGVGVTPMRAPGNTAPAGTVAESGRRQGGGGGILPQVTDRTPVSPLNLPTAQALSTRAFTTESFSSAVLNSARLTPLIRSTGPALQLDAVDKTFPVTTTPRSPQLTAPSQPAQRISSRH
ncbi:anti-sigma factor family protein [Streptomyces sp. NBC_00370]|uniref:anti-sigma factor family protein n=2 Tax=unclassified Streptomyces TaxID=2593676 RepID=UPI002E2717EE